jgi:predicted ATPase
MPGLAKLEVTNFKSIRHAELELRPLNVVIGPNGAGKSNLIGVFRLLGQVLEERFQEYVAQQGGAARLLHHGPKRSPFIAVRFTFARNGYSLSFSPNVADELFFGVERVHFRGDYVSDGGRTIGTGHREAKLPEAARQSPQGIPGHVMDGVHNWIVYHFHDTSETSPPKLQQQIDDNRSLRSDAGNLAAFLYRLQLRHPEQFARITAAVRRIAPFFAEFRLAPLANKPTHIKIEWRHVGSDAYFDGASLSDGTLRFICLATLLLQPAELQPSLILLDEPELGLHPAALKLLVEMLRSTAQRTQIVAATQSVTLLDDLAPEEVIVAEQSEGETTFRRLEEVKLRDWLEDYTIGELWMKNVLGGRPK